MLVEKVRLGATASAEARAQALEEEPAPTRSARPVYGDTPPAKHTARVDRPQ